MVMDKRQLLVEQEGKGKQDKGNDQYNDYIPGN